MHCGEETNVSILQRKSGFEENVLQSVSFIVIYIFFLKVKKKKNIFSYFEKMGKASCIVWTAFGLDTMVVGVAAFNTISSTRNQLGIRIRINWISIFSYLLHVHFFVL